MIRHLIRVVTYALALATATAAWAGTSHFYADASVFTCADAGCTKTDGNAVFTAGLAVPVPLLDFNNGTQAKASAVFWFPESHNVSDAVFSATIRFAAANASGSQKSCYKVGFAFATVYNGASTREYWALNGNEGTLGTGNVTFTPAAAGAESTVAITNVTSWDFGGNASCTYANCKNQPGKIWIERDPTSGGCSGGTTDDTLIEGVDVNFVGQ